MKEKRCPMKTWTSDVRLECTEEHCAWWCEATDECTVLALAAEAVRATVLEERRADREAWLHSR